MELASLVFYAVSGIILLVSLFLTNFAPELGLLGILSLIVAYALFTERGWAPWLLFILFIAANAFSLYTLVSAGFSNTIVGVSMVVYVILTWVFGVSILLKRRTP